jgi:hypothetical protein
MTSLSQNYGDLNDAYLFFMLASIHELSPIAREGYNLEMGKFFSMLKNVKEGGRRKSKRNRKNKRKTRKFKGGAYPDYPLEGDDPLDATREAIDIMQTQETRENVKSYLRRLRIIADGYDVAGVNPAHPNFSRNSFISNVRKFYLFTKQQAEQTRYMWGIGIMGTVFAVGALTKVYNTYQGEMLMAEMADQSTPVGMFSMIVDFASSILATQLNKPQLQTELMKGRREARSHIFTFLAMNNLIDLGVTAATGIGTRILSGRIGDINADLLSLRQEINGASGRAAAGIVRVAGRIQQTEEARDTRIISVAKQGADLASGVAGMACVGAIAAGDGMGQVLGAARDVGIGAFNTAANVVRAIDARGLADAERAEQDEELKALRAFKEAMDARDAAQDRELRDARVNMAFDVPLPLNVQNRVIGVRDMIAHVQPPNREYAVAAAEAINAPLNTVNQILAKNNGDFIWTGDVNSLTDAMNQSPNVFVGYLDKISSFDARPSDKRLLIDAVQRVRDSL